MKVACVSPHRVDETAIASVALQYVRCMRERIDIALFSDPQTVPSAQGVLGLELLPMSMRNVEPVRVFPATVEALAEYDVVHFHWGNYEVHLFQCDLCRKLLQLPNRPMVVSSIHDIDLPYLMGDPWKLWPSVWPMVRDYPDFWQAASGNIEDFVSRLWLHEVVRWSDHLIVHSEFAKQMVPNLLGGRLQPIPIDVIKLGSDASAYEFKPEEAQKYRSRYGLDGKTVFGYIGRLHPAKGIAALVRACHYLRDFRNRDDLTLLIAGCGPELPLLQHMCAKLIPGSYRIVGFADWPVHICCDVLIVPRAVVRGETSLLIPEAFAAGRPVIVPNMGSFPEYVNNDVGYLTLGNSDLDYMEAMLFFLDHPEEIRRRGENARRYVREELDFRAQADRYIGIYETALKNR